LYRPSWICILLVMLVTYYNEFLDAPNNLHFQPKKSLICAIISLLVGSNAAFHLMYANSNWSLYVYILSIDLVISWFSDCFEDWQSVSHLVKKVSKSTSSGSCRYSYLMCWSHCCWHDFLELSILHHDVSQYLFSPCDCPSILRSHERYYISKWYSTPSSTRKTKVQRIHLLVLRMVTAKLFLQPNRILKNRQISWEFLILIYFRRKVRLKDTAEELISKKVGSAQRS
jgi:hypothetical protein